MEFLLYVVTAFALGALHALEPGHGKAIVGAYLVGSRGTIRDAITLGIIVAITHSGSVIIIGAIAMFAAEYFVTDTIQLVMAIISALLILGVGIWMLSNNIRSLKKKSHDHNDHDHHHGHSHEHHGHSHTIDLEPGERPTFGQLVALGVSGGLVPCPAALVVLMAAVSYVDFIKGLFLVIVFSMGTASALVIIGILMVKAAEYMKVRMSANSWIKYIPLVSAILITFVGLGLTIYAVYNIISGTGIHQH